MAKKFKKVELADSDGNFAKVAKDGGLKIETDVKVIQVLIGILEELKINNVYMEQIVGEKFTEIDVEK